MTRARRRSTAWTSKWARNKHTTIFISRSRISTVLKSGEFPMAGLDDKVRRNLRVMIATHVLDPGRKPGSLNTAAHQNVARRVAEEGIVLLKNENHTLPLDAAKLKTIAVIGENATRLHAHGGDSSGIKAFYEITPLARHHQPRGPRQVNMRFTARRLPQGRRAPDLAQNAPWPRRNRRTW